MKELCVIVVACFITIAGFAKIAQGHPNQPAPFLVALAGIEALAAADQYYTGEGCSHGYWKNHTEDWAGFNTTDDFDIVFGTNFFQPDRTLLAALQNGGGGANRLAREGVAALLNASHPSIAYQLTVDDVIAFVQARDFDSLREVIERGCPLGGNDSKPKGPGGIDSNTNENSKPETGKGGGQKK